MNKVTSKRSTLIKSILLAIGTFLILATCLAIGPLDVFYHGFSSEHVNIDEIEASDIGDTMELGDNPILLCEFSPSQSHFAGFEIYLANRKNLEKGFLALEIRDSNNKTIDLITVDLSQKNMTSWCHPITNANLDEGETYYLFGYSYDCPIRPTIQIVDTSYLSEDIVNGNALLGLAYQSSTFTLPDKAFLISTILCLWIALCGYVLFGRKSKKTIIVCLVVILGSLMCWNYSTSVLDSNNEKFIGFQEDSESLATSVIESKVTNDVPKTSRYGLGRIIDVTGRRNGPEKTPLLTEDDWLNGFSKSKPEVRIQNNEYTKKVAVKGNMIRFDKGAEYEIVSSVPDGNWITLTLSTENSLNEAKTGSLEDVVFLTPEGVAEPLGVWQTYISQFGLQGKAFQKLASFFNDYEDAVAFARWLCSVLLALVLIGIVLLANKKFNILLAGCFYVVFLLSPWIVNFANNLYWVEFTWFLPMLVGIFCSVKIENIKIRILSYGLVFLAVLVKCLCGYEYISAIMISAVAFPLADLIHAIFLKKRDYAIASLRAIIGIGLAALLGFFVAIMIHAGYRGGGSLVNGIIDIFQQDVLRRTSGGTLDAFAASYWPSLNASHWETLLTYFNFYSRYQSEIVTGVPGNLFSVLCIAPLVILFFDAKKGTVNYRIYALYFIFFFAAVSWFVLAKSHSYVHTHMNYVLWYFGFVQMCFYIVFDKARRYIKEARPKRLPKRSK